LTESRVASLDAIDFKILRELQVDASMPIEILAERIGLSHTPCWRRLKKMEDRGFIRGRVVLLSPEALDLGVTVFATITLKAHTEDVLLAFENAVRQCQEIVECFSMTGDRDYILRIVVGSVADYEKILKEKLLHLPEVASINSAFALKEIKYTTALPI